MLIYLVKKEVLIVKKYVAVMMLLALAIPVFISWQALQMPPALVFLIAVIYTELILCQYVSMKESIYPKAAALLCAAPYPRSLLVKAKYVFFLLVFAYCCVAYMAAAAFIHTLDFLTPMNVLVTLLLTALIYGVYMPVQYKFGYEKTKFFFMVFIIASPFVFPRLMSGNSKLSFAAWNAVSGLLQYAILGLIIVCILLVSLWISINIYAKKELL